MTPLLTARIVLLVVGIGLFVMSLRTEQEAYRWAAIAVLAVAIIIRLIDRGRGKRES